MPEEPEVVVLAATDPANPYGTILRWPSAAGDDRGRAPTRSVGSLVVLVNGALAAYISRGARQLLAFLPEDEPRAFDALARAARGARWRGSALLVDGSTASRPREHPLAPFLVEAGFNPSAMGFQIRHGGLGRGA